MVSNDSTINVETKNNRVNKMTKLHSIHLKFISIISHRFDFILMISITLIATLISALWLTNISTISLFP